MASLLVLLQLAVAAFVSATSTTFSVPNILTPHNEFSPPFRVTPRNLGFSVASVSNEGYLHDDSINSSYTLTSGFQGYPTFCSIQDRSFWFAGPVQIQDAQQQTVASTSSSVAMALDFSHPSSIRELSPRPESSWPVIPLTPAEQFVSATYNQTYQFDATAHCSLINDTSALQFWDAWSYNSGLYNCFHTGGSFLVIYTLDPATNKLTVSRPAPVYQKEAIQYPYGSFSTLTVQGMTYLYAWDVYFPPSDDLGGEEDTGGNHRDIHVAVAPTSTIEDKSTWKYYDNRTGTFSSTEPLPTTRRSSAAIIILNDFSTEFANTFLSASIFYSEYHDAYLLVYAPIYPPGIYVRYAPTPLGPWSSPGTKIMDPTQFGYNVVRYALASPIFFQTDGNGGQSLLLTLSSDYQTQAFKVNFS
ncbi:uncharacterized protein V1513DRAFT_238861 [Lipomyces chichibuensis]|uniref:uncharacterized protein n=1 Tax=Lipomyces chichibuensis TaxID=1546026 RepID=UPI003343E5D0